MTEPQLWVLIGVFSAAIFGMLTFATASVNRTLMTAVGGVLTRIEDLRESIKGGFDNVDFRFNDVARRLDGVDKRLEGVDGRLKTLDNRVGTVETKVDGLDRDVQAISRRVFGADTA